MLNSIGRTNELKDSSAITRPYPGHGLGKGQRIPRTGPGLDRAPILGDVAALALLRKTSVVHVVALVARHAGHRKLRVVGRLAVAVVAGKFLVCAVDLEVGPGVLVEIPSLPL